ncbi:hypothetical protein NPIL_672431, partial [Nephila pilipes]
GSSRRGSKAAGSAAAGAARQQAAAGGARQAGAAARCFCSRCGAAPAIKKAYGRPAAFVPARSATLVLPRPLRMRAAYAPHTRLKARVLHG